MSSHVPEIVGTPVCVVVHGGGLSEVDGVDDAEELEDGGASGLSVLMIGAEGFGISATEGGLRPALPISVAPMGMPIGPTGDPGDAVPAVAAPALPIGAHGPDALAVVPPPATPVPMPPPPALAPMPPPSNVVLPEAPVVALVTAAEAAAADNAPPHATPVRGSSGDAPEIIGARARRCELGRAQGNSRRPDWRSRTDAERRRHAQRQSGRDAGRLCLRGAADQ